MPKAKTFKDPPRKKYESQQRTSWVQPQILYNFDSASP